MLSWVVKNLHNSARRPSRTGFSLSRDMRDLSPSMRPSATQFSNLYSGIKISPNSHHRNTYAISNRYKTRVSSCGLISGTRSSRPACNWAKPFLDPAPSVRILIANPRLKFPLTHCKFSLLTISNRERMAISSPESSRGPLASNPQNPYTGPSAEGESSWKIPSY